MFTLDELIRQMENQLDKDMDRAIKTGQIKTTNKGKIRALLSYRLGQLNNPDMHISQVYIGDCGQIPNLDSYLSEYGCRRVSDKPTNTDYKYAVLK